MTLNDLDRRTATYKVVMDRIENIEREEFDGAPTARQHQAVVNDVLLGIYSEDLVVKHLSGDLRSPRRLVELVNAQRGERRSRNE
jgi:hypothetical protein